MQQLFELIRKSQHGDSSSMEILLDRFSPLLKRAAHQLDREDAFSELQFFLFTVIQHMDLSKMHSNDDSALAIYFKKSVNHEVIYMSRKLVKDNIYENYEDLNDFEKNRCEAKSSTIETYDALLMEDLKKVLNEREQVVVFQLYFQALTVAEIATLLHKSRQAVNNIKLCALKKLRKAYSDGIISLQP